MRRLIDRLQLRLRSLFRGTPGRRMRCSAKSEQHLDEDADDRRARHEPGRGRDAAQARVRPDRPHRGGVPRHPPRRLRPEPHAATCATRCARLPGSRCSWWPRRFRSRWRSAPTPRSSASRRAAAFRAHGAQPERLVHIRMGGGSHVSYQQWQALSESGALAGLAGYQIRGRGQLARPERSRSPDPAPRHGEFLRRPRRPGGDGPRIHRRRSRRRHATPAVAVISHGFWQRSCGGDPRVVGRTLVFNGRAYTVLGVLPHGAAARPWLRPRAGSLPAPQPRS